MTNGHHFFNVFYSGSSKSLEANFRNSKQAITERLASSHKHASRCQHWTDAWYTKSFHSDSHISDGSDSHLAHVSTVTHVRYDHHADGCNAGYVHNNDFYYGQTLNFLRHAIYNTCFDHSDGFTIIQQTDSKQSNYSYVRNMKDGYCKECQDVKYIGYHFTIFFHLTNALP